MSLSETAAEVALNIIVEVIRVVAKQYGESTEEVRKRVLGDLAKTAENPKDGTDKLLEQIEADLPDVPT